MNDDLEIQSTKTEETFFQNGTAHTVQDYLDGVDAILEEIVSTGDFNIGANTVRSMVSASHAVGISLAKLLHGMKSVWNKSMGDEGFFTYMEEFSHLKQITISRYIDAWSAIAQVPFKFRDAYLAMPMKNLNALGAALSQGYVVEDWETLSLKTNNSEFLKQIREEVKNKPERKGTITIFLEESGDLVAWCGDERVRVGYLETRSEEELKRSPILAKSLKRIIDSAGILIHS